MGKANLNSAVSVLFCGWLSVAIGGCEARSDISPTAPDESAVHAEPLRILVVDDPDLANVVQREWSARSAGEVEIEESTVAEIESRSVQRAADAIIYPAALLGELVEKDLLLPIPDSVLSHPGFDRHDLLAFDRGPNVSWGKTVYACSFGSPTFTLLYRRDLFDLLELSPPRTWSAYQDLASRLSDRDLMGPSAPPKGITWSGTAEPLARGWAGQVLLARAAAYARSRSRFSTLFNYKTMEPLIDQEPFVRALSELVAAAGDGPRNIRELTPHDVRHAIVAGRCAMALTWPSHALGNADQSAPLASAAISFAHLPGSAEVFDISQQKWTDRGYEDGEVVPLLAVAGRLGSVSRSSRRVRAALSMLATVTGKQLSGRIASRSPDTTLFRASHVDKAEDWIDAAFTVDSALQYAEVVQAEHEMPLWVFSVRIPGRTQYLNALDDAVHQALDGEPPARALEGAAQRWRGITEQFGVQAQRTAYARSLGLEP